METKKYEVRSPSGRPMGSYENKGNAEAYASMMRSEFGAEYTVETVKEEEPHGEAG